MNTNRLFIRHIFTLVLTLLIGDVLAQTGKIYYVNSANTTGDGETWNTAFPDLQSALAVATNGAQIWVAKGTYKPTALANGNIAPTDRNVFFRIPHGVSVYGHFAGNETSIGGRDLENTDNTTILSGDIGSGGDPSDNAYHVVGVGWGANPNISQDCFLDGFTIQDGNANGIQSISLGGRVVYRHTGAGLVIAGVNSHRLQFQNLIIKNNYASTQGAGVALYGANGIYKFHNVRFLHNEAEASGALYATLQNATQDNVNIEITSSYFEDNRATAGHGGAIYSDAPSLLIKENSQFIGNTAAGNNSLGGAIYMAGGDLTAEDSRFENNATITGNNSSNGGAIATASHADFTVTSTDNTFENNTATGSGGAIASQYKSLTVRGGMFLNNTANSTGANNGGGAIYINNRLLDIGENTIFRANSAVWSGGAILLTGTSGRGVIRNAFFQENRTDGQGGAIFYTGTGTMSHEITNTVFYDNRTESSTGGGGALYIGSSILTVVNSTFYGNTATTTGGALRTGVAGSNLTINNSIILGNSANTNGPDIFRGNGTITVNRSITQGASGAGITNNDLVATNPDISTIFLNTTDTEHANFLKLPAGSPAVNSGDKTLYIGDPEADQDFAGHDRLLGDIIDLGANESPYEDLASLGTVPSFAVEVGTPLSAITLPNGSSTVQATLTNNDTKTLQLLGTDPENNWELIDNPAGITYDPNIWGTTYKFWVPLQLPETTDPDWFSNTKALRALVQLTIQNTTTLTVTWNDGTGAITVNDNDEVELTYGEQATLLVTHDNPDNPVLDPIAHTVTSGGDPLVSWNSSVEGEYHVTALRANETGEEGTLKISLPGTTDFSAAERTFKVRVNPRPITVTAEPGQTKVYGEDDPTLTFFVTGLINNNQTPDVISGAPERIPGEDAGTYDITPGTLAVINNNYTWDTNNAAIGTFTITKAPQQVKLMVPDEAPLSVGTLPLIVSSSSSLPVTLSVNDPSIATVSGTDLILLKTGTITVTATQEGNNNYQEAPPISATFLIVGESTSQPVRVHPALSPNGDGINDFLFIEGIRDYPNNRLTIFNHTGNVIRDIEGYDNQHKVFTGEDLQNGTYFYRLNYNTTDNGKQKRLQGFFELRR